ncbi:bifunctional 4-hydroxy-2-oxoglutarate aldolase/2-dehydro-3-deoxy-phosphogluconate aldolase [Streptomyces sp. NPDC032472]|uniref:bifunctional 4-hydroxy-2-oxoglutarate aldolase/2-dehydro-3-deoxy-phosphogluconate aldolase n=1 Tax=Streptomyces sp. NPDC032472 TaxID=3155018 RepID=UPI0033E02BED
MSCHPYAALAAQRLLPVLRTADADAAVRRTTALLAAGCRVVELTTSVPGWAGAVARTVPLADAHGRPALVGVGTVTAAGQAEAALDAGAAFLVSPYPAPEVRALAARRGAVFVEGGFTPGEIAAAVGRAGAAKIFPAHVAGPGFLRSLTAVLPAAVLLPTGGIRPAEVGDWLAAGATAVGVGRGLPDDPAELAAVFAALAGPCCAGCGEPREHRESTESGERTGRAPRTEGYR